MMWMRRVHAVLLKRCPVCLEGAMFQGGGPLTMNEQCASCGHRFLREEGFFQGAMYVSYVLGMLEFAGLALLSLATLGPRLGLAGALGVAFIFHLLLVPQLFQYSRVIWAHLNVGTRATPAAASDEGEIE
jgi:uncharacterized protein (DUF983 family)